jgi:rhodanese-related sulfurtransferase
MSRNQVLGLAALLLGAVAMAGGPSGGHRVTLDTEELAVLLQQDADAITPMELADWILAGTADYRLLDLRDEAAYSAYRIPSAEHVPVARLDDHPLLRNERVVIYAGDDARAAQAWLLLKARRFPGVYLLQGGLQAWKDQVLFPALPEDAGEAERARFERARFVSEYFGGTPRFGSGTTGMEEAPPMPKVEMPANAPVTVRKKKKEGC